MTLACSSPAPPNALHSGGLSVVKIPTERSDILFPLPREEVIEGALLLRDAGLQRQHCIPGRPHAVLPAADRLDGFRDLLHQRCGQLIRSFLVAGEFPQLPFGLQILEGRLQCSRSCRQVPHPPIEAFAGAYGGFLEFLDLSHLPDVLQGFFGLLSDFDDPILLLGEGSVWI